MMELYQPAETWSCKPHFSTTIITFFKHHIFFTESKCDKDEKKNEMETVGCNCVQSMRREMLPAPGVPELDAVNTL